MTILEAYGTEQDQVIEDAINKYKSKTEKYGESWRSMDDLDLIDRFDEEVAELQNTDNLEDEYNELIDVINVASMRAGKILIQKNSRRK